jgi:hypothetical protein
MLDLAGRGAVSVIERFFEEMFGWQKKNLNVINRTLTLEPLGTLTTAKQH